jgi:hypothetical protein
MKGPRHEGGKSSIDHGGGKPVGGHLNCEILSVKAHLIRLRHAEGQDIPNKISRRVGVISSF